MLHCTPKAWLLRCWLYGNRWISQESLHKNTVCHKSMSKIEVFDRICAKRVWNIWILKISKVMFGRAILRVKHPFKTCFMHMINMDLTRTKICPGTCYGKRSTKRLQRKQKLFSPYELLMKERLIELSGLISRPSLMIPDERVVW